MSHPYRDNRPPTPIKPSAIDRLIALTDSHFNEMANIFGPRAFERHFSITLAFEEFRALLDEAIARGIFKGTPHEIHYCSHFPIRQPNLCVYVHLRDDRHRQVT